MTAAAEGEPEEHPAGHSSKRRFALQMQQPIQRSTLIDRIAFLVGTASAVWLAVLYSLQGVTSPWATLLFIPVWAITAYLVLPRLHRMLSDLYVPDYFFGRTRTADGLLGDPVNLGIDGSRAQLEATMLAAGWQRADEITAGSTWGIIMSTLTRRSYPTAPVSPLMLFGRAHDVAFQQEVEGNPKQRHHVRFWHCPPGWLLPGGAKTDWLGAGTYDTDVGLSLLTLQVTHRIDENTDEERDYVVRSMQDADPFIGVRVLESFTTGYHSRNGGGDRFLTDGDLPIVDVSRVEVPVPGDVEANGDVRERLRDTIDRAPLSVFAAGALVAVSAVIDFLFFLLAPETRALWDDGSATYRTIVVIASVLGALLSIGQLIMAWFVIRGGRRSRWILMILLIIGIATTAVDYVGGSVALGFNRTLLSASIMSLALIALSSASAREWTTRSYLLKNERSSIER